MNRQVAYLLAGVLAIMALLTTNCAISRASDRAEEFMHRADIEVSKRKMLEQQYRVLDNRAADLERENSNLATRVSQLQKKLDSTPVPPPPVPVPSTDPDLEAGLTLAGMAAGLKVQDTHPTSMFRQDAKLVWEWKEAAARVPGLEAHVGARIDLEKGMREEISGLKKQVVAHKDIIAVDQSIKQGQATEIASLNGAAKAAHTEAKAQYVKGWMKAAAAVVIGYGVGKTVR